MPLALPLEVELSGDVEAPALLPLEVEPPLADVERLDVDAAPELDAAPGQVAPGSAPPSQVVSVIPE